MYSSNYLNKPSFGANTSNSTFGASTSTFGQPAANTSMFSTGGTPNLFQNPNTSTFSATAPNPTGFDQDLRRSRDNMVTPPQHELYLHASAGSPNLAFFAPMSNNAQPTDLRINAPGSSRTAPAQVSSTYTNPDMHRDMALRASNEPLYMYIDNRMSDTDICSNLFGQTQQHSTTPLFGNSNTFGSPNKATFGFGATTPQTGLFGQQQPAQPSGSSLFPSNTTNLFGSPNAFAQGQSGTVVKFQPVTGTDTMQKNGVATSISTKHHCITCMKEYENKSLEELRFEDYSCNRKGPSQQTGFATAPFGATATPAGTSLFGQTDNKPSFGATSSFGQTSTFGQTTPGFGLTSQANTPNLFGKPAGFGTATSNTNTFGFNTTQTPSNPFSGSQAPKPFSTPLFGNTTTQSQPTFGTGVFGQTSTQNTTPNLFQKPAQPTTTFNTGQNMFSFNQTQTTQAPNLFNVSKPNTGFGIFGTANTGTTSFGQPNTLSTNFGKPATTTFGQPTQSAFGNNSLGGGTLGQMQPLFGNTAAKPTTGLFATTTPSTNLFSNNVFQQPTQPSFSLGGTVNQQPTSQFPSENTNDVKLMTMLATDTFPDGPHVYGLEPILSDSSVSTTNPQDLKSLLDVSKRREELSGTRAKIQVHMPKPKRGSNYSKEFFETNQALKSSHKCLVIRKFNDSSNTIYNKYKNELIEEAEECLKSSSDSDSPNSMKTPTSKTNSEKSSPAFDTIFERDFPKNKKVGLKLQFDSTAVENNEETKNKSTYSLDDSVTFSPITKASNLRNGLPEDDATGSDPEIDSQPVSNTSIINTESTENIAGVVLTKPEYYMHPPLKDLSQYIDENGRCVVPSLTIGRKGYGNVHFSEPIDITNMNFDEIVHFRHREIIVYPDDTKKPRVGEGLNRPAQVTLDKIYPREKGTNKYITDMAQIIQSNFKDNLMNITQKHNCKFVEYRPNTGSWVFQVRHFSKYGFTDSDEEECEVFGDKNKLAVLKQHAEITSKQRYDDLDDFSRGLGGGSLLNSVIEKSQNIIEMESLDSDEQDQIVPEPSDLSIILSDNLFMSESVQTIKSSLFTTLDSVPDFDYDEKRVSPVKENPLAFKSIVLSSPKVYKIPDLEFEALLPDSISTQRCYSDLGIFRNNTFKVGWGSGRNFYNFQTVVDSEVIYGLTYNSINNFDQGTYNDMMPSLSDMLDITLQECQVTYNSDIPTFSIKEDLGFLQKQTSLFNDHVRHGEYGNLSGKQKYLSSIWNLCTALWGRGDDSCYSRRQYFSDWLKKFSYDLSDELNLSDNLSYNKNNAFEKIFKLLSFHKVAEACDYASKNNLNQLSLLISQLCANERFKQWMKKYVECFAWKEKGIIPDDFKKLYLLLSGIPVDGAINTCENLDWMRCLGLHLWYIAPAAAPLDVAVNLYKKAFSKEIEYAAKPNPPYCDPHSDSETFDLLYHILQLYTESTYQLCYVLDPATHTENIMDYRLSWHLLQLFQSLKVGLIRESEMDYIHTTFSNQLESMGHWKWAIFVLLFLNNNQVKHSLVSKILDRHLSEGSETAECESDLVNTFKIPADWIHDVKATKAKLSGNYYAYFQHVLYMHKWQDANDAMNDHILPELFINEQYQDLLELLHKLDPVTDMLENWGTNGGLIKDFIEVNEMLRHSDENAKEAFVKLQSVCRRAVGFPSGQYRQKLCLAELSRKCALLFKIIYKKLNTDAFKDEFVNIVKSLVMPTDYKQFEVFYAINKSDNIVH